MAENTLNLGQCRRSRWSPVGVTSFDRSRFSKTIKVGIYQNKPKVFIDSAGEPQGFIIDILNHIASKEDWQLDYVVSTWEKNLEKLETAEINLLLDIAESEGRTELFDFNKEIIFSNWAII